MGKVTLYHPVSLTVLRGALAYGGWTVGRFSQVKSDLEHGYAVYTVPLLEWSRPIDRQGMHEMRADLNSCFASDVTVTAVWVTPSGQHMARLETTTRQQNFIKELEQ